MRTLIIPCGANAVKKYRFWNAREHLDLGDVTILDIGAEIDDADESRAAFLLAQANVFSLNPAEYVISEWVNSYGDQWDLVWTNDFREVSVVAAEFFQEKGARVVADVDDWFLDIPTGNVSHIAWGLRKKRVYEGLLKFADTVTCSTVKLQDRFGGVIAPNFIIPEEWEGEVRPTRKDDECLICCPAGGGRAEDYLDLEDAFRSALQMDHVKMLFIGWMPEWAMSYPAGKVIYSTWLPLELYPKAMRWISPDIIASPMQHHDFNEAKSNLKWLEAGAIGSCFIGEDFGEYRRHIETGVTGVLADGISDWTEKLMWLCDNPDSRRGIAARGRAEVLSKWTWDAVEDQWRKGVLQDGRHHHRRDLPSGEFNFAAQG